MADHGSQSLLRVIRKIADAGELRQQTDSQLLQRYAVERNETALDVLVRRHGALVWRICWSTLRDSHRAEDAFQATFLILVRKAASIGRPELLANWLYGVAHRVALRARKTAALRAVREPSGVDMVAIARVEDPVGSDLQPLLHEELQRLPAKYRAPMVLCYLEGSTNEEAARQLRWPVGTLKVRLLRGRELLRKRLIRRGLTLSAAGVTSLACRPATAPAALVNSTIEAALAFAAGHATAALSAQAIALTEGVLKMMWWNSMKAATTVLLGLGLLGGGYFTIRALAMDRQIGATASVAVAAAASVADSGDDLQKARAEVKKLQGTWKIVGLEIDGAKLPENVSAGSKIVINGDSFTTISMGGAYKGTYKIDVSSTPKKLDLTFTEGPEKGNTSLGIYELDGDSWKICLTIGAKERPKAFATKAGSGHAFETLKREADDKAQDALQKDVARLEGEWSMVLGEREGQRVPEAMFPMWKRVAKGNETTVTFAGQTMLKATFTVDTSKKPHTIDYTLTEGPNKGKKQYGIYEWDGDSVRFCFASPGKDRPTEFATKAGDERTLSVWKKAKAGP